MTPSAKRPAVEGGANSRLMTVLHMSGQTADAQDEWKSEAYLPQHLYEQYGLVRLIRLGRGAPWAKA